MNILIKIVVRKLITVIHHFIETLFTLEKHRNHLPYRVAFEHFLDLKLHFGLKGYNVTE